MEPEQKDLLKDLVSDLAGNYERLVAYYWNPLKGFVVRRMIPVSDAEDLVQEIFIRIYLDLRRSSAEKIEGLKLRSWMYTIAWNMCSNYLTRNKRPQIVWIENEESPLFELEDVQSEQPENLFELRERREELEALVGSLPDHYRIVVSMYYFEGFTQPEIAEMLQIRVGTVKVHVHRGLKLLQKALATETNKVR